MVAIKPHDRGPAVEDVQQRLSLVGLLGEEEVTGEFDERTAAAVREFRRLQKLPDGDDVDTRTWSALVDASFRLGDRTLYLRMPYFHGRDVYELQNALAVLGFTCGDVDGIFGAFTESALRTFQLNLGLPSDGIAGAYTYAAIRNLHHSWEGKQPVHDPSRLGFARAADVLEGNALCLFGTNEFTRSVASRMSNLALATNPASKITSAESLLVAPDADMLLVHIVLPDDAAQAGVPRVGFVDDDSLPVRLASAIGAARGVEPARVAVELPGTSWMDAGPERTAQHYAITLLDALCLALS